MSKGSAKSLQKHNAPQQVLQLAVSSLDTLSAVLRLPTASSCRAAAQLHPPASAAQYTLDQVAEHCHCDDCWVVIFDCVYDVTSFMRRHPGGADILLENAGRDASNAFYSVGHSRRAVEMMQQYKVGLLAPHQCMWRDKDAR